MVDDQLSVAVDGFGRHPNHAAALALILALALTLAVALATRRRGKQSLAPDRLHVRIYTARARSGQHRSVADS